MGSCCTSPAPQSADRHRQASGVARRKEQLILKLLVEVNTLSADDGPLRWQPFFHSLVPLSLHSVEEGEVHVYRVSATGVDGTTLSATITLPGTKVRKTAECFIQWRDLDGGGALGLNFMSEADAVKFLDGCTPPGQVGRKLPHALSTLSLSLPIPNPPSAQDLEKLDVPNEQHESHLSSDHSGLDSIILEASESQNPKPMHLALGSASNSELSAMQEGASGPMRDSIPNSPSEISIATTYSEGLPTPDISYASLLALDQLSPESSINDGDIPRYSPPVEFDEFTLPKTSGTSDQTMRSIGGSNEDRENGSMSPIAASPVRSLQMPPLEDTHSTAGCDSDPGGTLSINSDSYDGDDVIGDPCNYDDDPDTPRLFQPSSPLEVGKNFEFILPDIVEVSESEEEDDGDGPRSSNPRRRSESNGSGTAFSSKSLNTFWEEESLDGSDLMQLQLEEVGLEGCEYGETSFSENDPGAADPSEVLAHDEEQQNSQEVQSNTLPPCLPVSPPPGPVLSPRYSMLLAEEEGEQIGEMDKSIPSYNSPALRIQSKVSPDSKFPALHSQSKSTPDSKSDSRPHAKRKLSPSFVPLLSDGHSAVSSCPRSLSPVLRSKTRNVQLLAPPQDTGVISSPQSVSSASDRLSIISLTDDIPPPLPATLPPGKLISPRHSMLINSTLNVEEIGEVIWSSEEPTYPRKGLDLALLSAQVADLAKQRGSEDGALFGTEEEKSMDGKGATEKSNSKSSMLVEVTDSGRKLQDKSDEEVGSVAFIVPGVRGTAESRPGSEANLEQCGTGDWEGILLPPPLGDGFPRNPENIRSSSQNAAKLKLTPSFLRSLKPPVEFSDSGCPDTDTENYQATNTSASDHSGPGSLSTAGDGQLTATSRRASRKTSEGDASAHELEDIVRPPSPAVLPGRKYSLASANSYSDERLTEYSGSVGMKTNASSGSLASMGSREGVQSRSSSCKTLAEEASRGGEDRPMPSQTTLTAIKPYIRKTGWLEVKAMLVRKNRKVAMASKRRWKRYWGTLKGPSLLLYQCDDTSNLSESAHVDLKLDLELCLVHAVHDHVKRDHILCMSTSNGNAYYLQTVNQAEVEDWITTIHCAAAIAMTQQHVKDEAVKVLKSKVDSLNKMIEKESQLRNLTELNQTAVSDHAARSMATQQLVACAENIEQYNVELYRIRCYVASLQGTELPNPQSLLGCVSKATKVALGRVGIFSVASLHATVSARLGGTLTRSGSQKATEKAKASKRKGSSSSRTPEKRKRSLEISGPYPISPLSPTATLLRTYHDDPDFYTTDADDTDCLEVPAGMPVWPAGFLNVVRVKMPGNQVVQVAIRNDMTARDVLINSCEKLHLNPNIHFLRQRWENDSGEFECDIPSENELFVDLRYAQVEICQKFIHTVALSREKGEHGLILEPEWDSSGTRLESVLVERVEEGGTGDALGVNEGDEVLLMNDTSVLDLGWNGVMATLQAASVSLTLRTCYVGMPVMDANSARIMEGLICPAPPSHAAISGETLSRLIVPMPSMEDLSRLPLEDSPALTDLTRDQIDILLKDSHEVSKLLRSWKMQKHEANSTPWTKEDRLRKSASDLVETEREYIRLLDLLIERYLEPLKYEKFISQEEVEVLSGNIVKITGFQKKFLNSLEEALEKEIDGHDQSQLAPGDSPLKHMVLGVAEAFLYYVDHFRLYSTFCASHHRVKRIVSRQDNVQLQEFLEARNPKKDPSLNFDALMAKPIVRVSRYPLFLNAILDNTPPDSEERMHLQDAIEGMLRVANYINEMQRISEMYSSLFDSMLKDSGLNELGVSVNVPQLKYHSQVVWLNPTEEQRARGWKKGQGPEMLCFVFSSAIVLLCLDKKFKRRGSKPSLAITLSVEDLKYKTLLPSVQCGVHDLPDSDGVTNMWQLLYKSKPGAPPINYLLRSQSIEQKSTMVHLVRQSIQEQQLLYGSRSGRATPSSIVSSSFAGRGSPSLPQHHLIHRLTSSTASHYSLATGYCTSDTDHD